jgi:serine/threonine-protein kinase
LVGVLAPTHDERNEHLARGANSGPQATDPDGGNQHASSENDDSSTSTTMPSLRSHRLRDAQDQRAGHDSDGEDSAVFPRSSAHASHARGADAHNFGNEDQLDHYQVLECLAKGGSGVVYLVKEPNAASDQLLALKVLRQGNHKIIEAVESLNREARLMDALRHPNLVALSHFGHENGEPFLLMEYVEGLSMSELLQHPVPLPLDVGLIVIQDALEALDYVHHAQVEGLAGGLVHCDVSPQNLLVGSDGRTRLIDFGTSREPGESLGDAAVRCKPRYSSPEMMAGDAVGPQSDIFSMGAVLFQLLSKQPAFSADPKRRKKESLVPNPSMLNRRAPTPLDPVCQRALDPDSCERYSSAREMLEALDAAVDQAGIELRRQRVNFWVRRVLQSRQGDVEFDMNELEDLLDSKPPARASGNAGEFTAVREEVVAGPPSSGEEHTQDVEPTKGRSVPPPAVEQRLARRRVDELQSGASPSSESRIGAASRFVSGRDDSQLSLKTRMTITGIAIGIAIALLIFALIKPDIFKSWFPVQQEPDWSGERRRSPEAVPDPRVSAEERAKRLREKIRAAAEAEPTQGSPLANEPEAEPAAPAADRAGDRVAESESERLEERATTARNRAAPKITAVPKSESTAEAKPAPERAARQPKTQRAPAAETRLPTEAEPPAEQAATATPEPSPRPQPAPTMEIEAAPETEASKSKPPPGTPPPPKPNPEVGSGLPNAPSVAAKPKSPTTTSPAPVTPRTEARPRTPQIGPITPP